MKSSVINQDRGNEFISIDQQAFEPSEIDLFEKHQQSKRQRIFQKKFSATFINKLENKKTEDEELASSQFFTLRKLSEQRLKNFGMYYDESKKQKRSVLAGTAGGTETLLGSKY